MIRLLFALALSGYVAGVPNSRIIGGEPAILTKYPFTASINVQTSTSKFFCGGSLYTTEWLITAGQCVNGAVLFTIRLGSVHLTGDEATAVTLATSEYVLHPDFNPQTLENDIGLIKLRMPIVYTDFINRFVPLATYHLGAATNLRVIGWGQTTNSSLSSQLMVSYVSALTNDECKTYYGSQIKDSMICVVGNYNEGACHGDTGSPLIDSYSRYANVHVGIASFVSGNGCETPEPSGYTRMWPYVSWVNNITLGTG